MVAFLCVLGFNWVRKKERYEEAPAQSGNPLTAFSPRSGRKYHPKPRWSVFSNLDTHFKRLEKPKKQQQAATKNHRIPREPCTVLLLQEDKDPPDFCVVPQPTDQLPNIVSAHPTFSPANAHPGPLKQEDITNNMPGLRWLPFKKKQTLLVLKPSQQ